VTASNDELELKSRVRTGPQLVVGSRPGAEGGPRRIRGVVPWARPRGHRVGHAVDEDTVFRIDSISKTLTAIAVMQQSEHGLVGLNALADDYLRAYRLIPARAGFRPATLRHGRSPGSPRTTSLCAGAAWPAGPVILCRQLPVAPARHGDLRDAQR